MTSFSRRWQQWRANVDLDEYDRRWDQMAASGGSVHGEVDFVTPYLDSAGLESADAAPLVLDAGSGMGRVGIELAARGSTVVGVDNDDEMLAYARRRLPEGEWVCADLAQFTWPDAFDLIVAAGNVLVFVEPDDRAAVVANLAGLLGDAGLLITGATYGVDFSAGLTLADFDAWCSNAGLELVERFAGWEREPFTGGDYAVSVHRSTKLG